MCLHILIFNCVYKSCICYYTIYQCMCVWSLLVMLLCCTARGLLCVSMRGGACSDWTLFTCSWGSHSQKHTHKDLHALTWQQMIVIAVCLAVTDKYFLYWLLCHLHTCFIDWIWLNNFAFLVFITEVVWIFSVGNSFILIDFDTLHQRDSFMLSGVPVLCLNGFCACKWSVKADSLKFPPEGVSLPHTSVT